MTLKSLMALCRLVDDSEISLVKSMSEIMTLGEVICFVRRWNQEARWPSSSTKLNDQRPERLWEQGGVVTREFDMGIPCDCVRALVWRRSRVQNGELIVFL